MKNMRRNMMGFICNIIYCQKKKKSQTKENNWKLRENGSIQRNIEGDQCSGEYTGVQQHLEKSNNGEGNELKFKDGGAKFPAESSHLQDDAELYYGLSLVFQEFEFRKEILIYIEETQKKKLHRQLKRAQKIRSIKWQIKQQNYLERVRITSKKENTFSN